MLAIMRTRALGLATIATLVAACGDDERATSITSATQPNPTSITSVSDSSASSTGQPEPTTGGSSPTEGGGTLGTDSGAMTTTASTTVTTEPGTTGSPMCTDADCPQGQYCDGVSGTCIPGCNDDTDCTAPAVCDVGGHTCKGCVIDGNCPLGQVCDAGTCVPGCNDMQPCQDGLACCADTCVDPLSDPSHCGGCDKPCPDLMNAAEVCAMGACGLGACDMGYSDCDKDPNNGCENQGACQCTPGAQEACYSGPMGTAGVGVCKAGTHTCNPQGTGWGACTGEVLPGDLDICANGLDDNCDGKVDEDPDQDKDGWTVCGGDCCDVIGPNCLNPELVNPGAFEVTGNMVDDNCDAMQDNVLPACDAGLPSNSADPLQYAKAIDICQTTTENPPLKDKKWGVISGLFARSNGLQAPAANAKAIRPGFGAITPQKNSSIAVLSTGNAADSNDANPPYAAFQGGTDLGTDAAVPADWLTANGNNFPNAPGCPEPQGGTTGLDTILLKLRVRVPTNALSFSVRVYMLSSEYPEWVCSPYNDFFLTLVDGQGANNPADKNVAVYKNNQNQLFPLGVNILKAAAGLFSQCKNGNVGCGGGAIPSVYNGCVGNAELVGTGMDPLNPLPKFGGDPGYCGANNQVGGGTGWLKMSGNVKPGETMELRFVIWDTGDEWYDSVVLLDNFEWSVQASQPGVQPG